MRRRICAPSCANTRLAVALICAGFAGSPDTAFAEPTTAERETARSLMDEADALRVSGDLQRALERYLAADQLMRVPTTGLEVARTQAQLLRLVDACATALEVANAMPRQNEPPVFAQARTAAQALADSLRPRIPSFTLRVEPIGVTYELRFDGVLVPDAAHGLPYKLDPGRHIVAVQAPGFRTYSETVVLSEGQHLERRVTLAAAVPPPSFEAMPLAAAVATPPTPAREVTASSSERPPEQADDNSAGRTRGYVALGIGGAVLVAGIATGIAAWVETESAKDQCDGDRCPPSAQPAIDRANTLANISNVTLAVGLVGVGYGLVELLIHADDAVEHARSGPHIALAGPFGLSVRGDL